jgi:hypothetical protein
VGVVQPEGRRRSHPASLTRRPPRPSRSGRQ